MGIGKRCQDQREKEEYRVWKGYREERVRIREGYVGKEA